MPINTLIWSTFVTVPRRNTEVGREEEEDEEAMEKVASISILLNSL